MENGAAIQTRALDNYLFLLDFPENLVRLRTRRAEMNPGSGEPQAQQQFRCISVHRRAADAAAALSAPPCTSSRSYVREFTSTRSRRSGSRLSLWSTSPHNLAQHGKSVLLVDFDLEAPGLDVFRPLRPKAATPGIVRVCYRVL